jgi:hypothetical protein
MELAMKGMTALRTGLAFAVTVAVAYAACALVFRLWPEAAAAYLNVLFHGLDFGKLRVGADLFSFTGFIHALAVTTLWAFLFGVLFGALQQWLRTEPAPTAWHR